MSNARDRILILGIGNLLWADEGFGVRCVEVLGAESALPPSVRLMDGGTQGLYLLPYVTQASHLLVFDAIDYGLAPGSLKLVRGDEVPRFMGAKKMSLHQTGFQEVIAAAALLGRLPRELVLIGVQPAQLEDFGGSLSEPVRGCIGDAIALAGEVLASWGASLRPRTEGRVDADALAIDRYECGRPSAALACRHGDARFLPAGEH
ncbi:MAG: HyaD/HybD family hydrogenase maturation endopeptidase [Rhodocyclaceae bacterium]|nr:HyaD/HybD family hydrogenase maturation endopeptidase [Rhodocyclaceae bacterium]